MRFGDYVDWWTLFKRNNPKTRDEPSHYAAIRKDPELYYSLKPGGARSRIGKDSGDPIQSQFEHDIMLATELEWHRRRRPYFNCWPSILPALARVPLEKLTCRQFLNPPHPYIELRFPEQGFPRARAALVGVTGGGNGTVLSLAVSRQPDGEDACDMATTVIPIFDDAYDEPVSLDLAPYDETAVQDAPEMTQVLRVAMASLLLQGDENILTPDLLADDRYKWDRATAEERERLVEKANRRRGRIGFDFGKICEVSPHWRNPHMALFWTGKGRTVPKVQMRAGALVKREKIKEVPTGYRGTSEED